MPAGFYFSFTYSEWWNHSLSPDNRQICSIVESILTALESGMTLATQWRKNDPKTRQRPHRTGRSEDVIRTQKGIVKEARTKGDVDAHTVRQLLELLHSEIRRIMRRTDLNLLSRSCMGDAKIEATLTDVLIYFNTRLMQLMSSSLATSSSDRANCRKNARLELLELSGYAGERTICALLNLERGDDARPNKGPGPPALLLPPPPGVAGKIDERRSPQKQSQGKPPRRQEKGTSTHKGGKHKKRNKPCGKAQRPATNESSLSMATTAVPSSLHQHPNSEDAFYPEVRPVDSLPPALPPSLALGPPLHQAPAQLPASAFVPIPPCSKAPEKTRTSVFSFPSDSTHLGEIPPHKLARPLRPNNPRGEPTTVSGKPGRWKKWMGKG